MNREAGRLVKRVVRGDAVDEEGLCELKRFARRSDAHVLAVFGSVWDHLSAPNALERLLALQLCAHLWSRSAAFRHALLEQLVPRFVQLILGCDESWTGAGRCSCSLQRQWTEQLRSEGMHTLQAWHASHGHLEGYRALGLALRHMRQHGTSSRPLPDAASAARSWRERYDDLVPVATARLGEIWRCMAQLRECLRILAPSLEETIGVEAWMGAPSRAVPGCGSGVSGSTDEGAGDEGADEEHETEEQGCEEAEAEAAWLRRQAGVEVDLAQAEGRPEEQAALRQACFLQHRLACCPQQRRLLIYGTACLSRPSPPPQPTLAAASR